MCYVYVCVNSNLHTRITRNTFLAKQRCKKKEVMLITIWLFKCTNIFCWKISREKFEPEPGFEPRTSSLELYHLSYPGSHASSCSNLPLETDATFTTRCGHDTICHFIFFLRSYNVNFPRHKLWVCFQLIIWFEYIL